MPRKKRRRTTSTTRKNKRTTTRKRKKPVLELNIKKSVMKEIYGVVYLALGVFTILSIFGNFGILGTYWIDFLAPIFGWGIYIIPIALIIVSMFFFLSKKVSFPVSKIIGLTLMLIAVLSVLHLSVPMDSILTSAQAGEYGGYIGFVVNFLFLEVFKIGVIGSTAVFIALFLIGILMAFEVSLVDIFKALKPDFSRIKINQVDDIKESKHSKKENAKIIYETDDDMHDFDQEKLAEQIDDLPDSEFGMPVDYEDESTIKIKRAAISDSETQKTNNDQMSELASVDSKTQSIPIKDESDALTSESQKVQYDYNSPSLDLLSPAVPDVAMDDDLLAENAKKIQAKLEQFGIHVQMHEVHVGPTVIQYTLKPHEGIKLSKITSLKNDLALALAATSIRIEAPIPGKGLVGIEVPNDHRSVVHLREVMESKDYQKIESNLRIPLGRDVSGRPMCGDLQSMPHLLIAGATGSGKSVGMNSFILSFLYQNSPEDLRLIMIDPKRVELTGYNGLPHLLTPVITDPEKAAIALRWAVAEMNKRYQLFSEYKCRNISDYNDLCEELAESGGGSSLELEGEHLNLEEGTMIVDRVSAEQTRIEEDEQEIPKKMPKIVIIIDELADLMMSAGKEVEASICRIAQMARAVGLHLVIATQRPSVDVITGLIKANIPARIAFAVSSSVDSRTILDGIGAEDLLGKGDMLYLPGGQSKPTRVQGIYVSPKEIERVVNNLKINNEAPDYHDEIVSPKVVSEMVQGLPKSNISSDADDTDELYEQALRVVMEARKASASLLQRRLKVGYARAARLLDLMEDNGAIGPVNGAKPREIYVE
ncbi:hypothetical protein GF376_04215 [Candidatus Peregrinibacteria bacterium]|nr:hypothetical protein [Candidatus Peregrinibacteria bacterium]